MLLVFTIQLIFIVGSAHFQWSQIGPTFAIWICDGGNT